MRGADLDGLRGEGLRAHDSRRAVEPGYSTLFYLEAEHHVWFDGAELFDARGQWNGGNPLGGNRPFYAYYTDAYLHDIQNAGYHFGRNVVLENIGSDVFRGSSGLKSINLVVHGIDSGATEAHPDFFSSTTPMRRWTTWWCTTPGSSTWAPRGSSVGREPCAMWLS